MARFYASIQGSRGEATRGGSERSGIRGHVRGWNLGGEVECVARGEHDTVSLLLTGGSREHRNFDVGIAAFEEEGPRVRYVVRLPGGLRVHGYVGSELVKVTDAHENVLWTSELRESWDEQEGV